MNVKLVKVGAQRKVLTNKGKVVTNLDCCCGVGCSFVPTKITFSGVTFPGCCLTEGGFWFKFLACSPVTGNCYDINQTDGWPLTLASPNTYAFLSGFSDGVRDETDWNDSDCTDFAFDNGLQQWGISVTCDADTGLWSVIAGETYKYFTATGIADPTIPFANDCTCGGSPPPIIGRCSGEAGTAVLA